MQPNVPNQIGTYKPQFFATEPEQNVFNYTGGDVVLDIAEDHGKLVRCHNLIWSNQLSDWVTNGNWTLKLSPQQ